MDNITKEKDEISLKDLIENLKEWYVFLLTKWKTIGALVIVGGTLGLTYSLLKKPIYTATLSFALEDDNSNVNIGGALGLASSLGLDVGGSGGGMFSSSNLTQLFKSRSMVEKTLLLPVNVDNKAISLAEMYIQNNNWRKKWEGKQRFESVQFLPNANRKTFTRDQDSIMGAMYEKLSKSELKVEQKDKKISIITIEVSDNDELFAKYFCEGLAVKVSEFYVSTKSKRARINMDILERQRDSIRSELNSAITGVAVATDNTFNLNPALNVRKTPSVRRQVDVQANTAILTELVKQVELAKVTLRRETPLIQIIDRPILPLQKERFGKVKGLMIGGLLAGFITILWLVLRKLLKDL
ncbi:Wzz/FepE/Etk N-terminal domain-containing protein [Flavobacterium sp. SH_e]|uniref:Wzz/FepE/Etk N-terminal domain-containing protein n=1 Tax=Flavobacterium TaxID=237 RepID=UPI0021E4C7E7|nr:Wzz/FepE/Etk N-terminal domain-containing protein [Flavobacterium sp. SH_e]MCV2483980.1 Wzz/FepE/Etk N-terminal domain-containing protein [Flavobacterium sp. SH_e]